MSTIDQLLTAEELQIAKELQRENELPGTETQPWDLIHSYSRAEAIDDGVLVDLSEADGAKGHFRYPLACTAAVWAIIESAVANKHWCNDLAGVLHDICWMSKCGVEVDPTTRMFQVIIRGAGKKSKFTFKIVCGPGDAAEPVLTIMLPEED